MKKRTLSLITALALCLSLLPAAALADETEDSLPDSVPPVETVGDPAEEPEPAAEPDGPMVTVDAVEETYIPDADDLPDSDELFAGYVMRAFYGDSGISLFGNFGERKLTGKKLAIYQELKAGIEKIANGETASTVINVTTDLDVSWTTTATGDDLRTEAGVHFSEEIDISTIIDYLLMDCPYELYWYDKTAGCSSLYTISSSTQNGVTTASLSGLSCTFRVSQDYGIIENGSMDFTIVDTENTKATSTAVAKAQEIVDTNEGKSDYEKLVAYKEAICDLVSYNATVAGISTYPYGDPWQLIYVFDGDTKTNVVCEGYSKAFQYLCDLSTFTGGVACYTVTGMMAGGTGEGAHMWNIVTIDGNNYLVDVTNSDEGSVGAYGGLFLAGTSNGNVDDGYTISISSHDLGGGSSTVASEITYAYDADMTSLYGTGILTLADSDYTPPVELPNLSDATVTLSGTSFTYDGTEQKPTVSSVILNNTTLAENTDYTVSYTDGEYINAGTYTVTITAMENSSKCTGSKEVTFTIGKKDLTITANEQTITYGGEISQTAYTPTGLASGDTVTSVTLAASGTNVTTEGTITPSEAVITRGDADVTANYKITYQTGTLTIEKSKPQIAFKSGYAPSKTYDGTALTVPESALEITGAAYKDVQFTWYEDSASGDALDAAPKDAGTYYVTATIPETANTESASATSDAITISKLKITVTPDSGQSKVYDAADPELTYTVNPALVTGDTLSGALSRKSGDAVGTYDIEQGTLAATNYDLTVTPGVTFEITAATLAGATVTVDGTYTYDGSAQTPTVTVTLGGTTLVKGTDYTVSYSLNGTTVTSCTNAGTYTVTVAAAGGNYTGTQTTTFIINPKALTDSDFTMGDNLPYTGSAVRAPVTVSGSLSENTDYTISGAATLTDVQTTAAEITFTGKGNYTGEVTMTWNLTPVKLSLPNASVESKTYDGTNTATILLGKLSGVVGTDDVSVAESISGTFADAYAGTGKTVTPGTFTLRGTKAGNYTLAPLGELKGDITAAEQKLTSSHTTAGTAYSLTKGGATVDLNTLVSTNAEGNTLTFTIDGTTCATLNGTTLTSTDATGLVAVTVSAAAYSVGGSDDPEYSDAQTTIYIKVVDKKTDTTTLQVTQSNITYGDKVNPTVTVKPDDAGDVKFSYFGRNNTSYSSSTAPTDAGDYTVTATCESATTIYTAKADFTISPKNINGLVKLSVDTVVYNGSEQSVSVSAGSLEAEKDYTVTGATSGTDAGSYTVIVTGKGNYIDSVQLTWTITPKPVTATVTAEDKTYDGSTNAEVTVTVNDLVSGDKATITGVTGAFADANAGENKSVTVDTTHAVATIRTSEGTDITGNYTITYQTSGVTATINKDASTTPPAEGEGYSINYPTEIITVVSGYEIGSRTGTGSVDDVTPMASGDSITSILDDSMKTLWIRKVEDNNHAASEWAQITLKVRPVAPTLTKTDESIKGKGDGKVAGLTSAMEYSTDGTTWKAASADLTDLAAGTTVTVRVKATDSAPHGEESSVTIGAGEGLTVKFDSEGNTVTSQTDLSYQAKVTRPADPTRGEDYEFQGWYKDAAGNTAWDFARDTVTANTTLYAKWKQVRFHVTVTVKDNGDTSTIEGATVTLMQGNDKIDSGTTDGDGKCTFSKSVAPGAYNIVTTYTPEGGEEQTKTSLVTITNADPTVAVKLPPVGVNSHLTVGDDNSTRNVVVGGLDEEAEALKTEKVTKVTVSMSVAAKTETEADGATQIKQTAGTGAKLEYLAIDVTKTVTTSGSDEKLEDVSETTKVLQIVVPYDFTGKKSVTVYRCHEGEAEALKKVSSRDEGTEGTYLLDQTNKLIHIFASKFSTYAIGYTEDSATTPDTPSRPSTGHSSGSSVTTYPVTADSAKHGTVTVSPKNASKGTTVTITVKPDDGYELDSLTVTDASGDAVKVTQKSDTKYTFTMPASKITVEAAFAKIEEQPAHSFRDVAEGHWAENEIAWAYENGYMNGNTATTFNPNGTVTRQQLWMILARLSGERPASFAEARVWAVDNGVSDGTNPGNAVSRQQLVTILYRYAALKGYRVSGTADLTAFPDHASVAAYATDAMGWSVANGIVGGTAQGTLNPAGTATRAQFAVILYRFCGNIAK